LSNAVFVSLYDTNTLSLAPHMLAQAMSAKVLECSIFTDTVEDIVRRINSMKADLVGFSVYIWNFSMVKKILPLLRGSKIIGGPHVRDMEDEYEADVIVAGDVRLPLLDYSKLDLNKYEWIPFETSRGCPMGCGYCTWSGSKMRYYPLDYVFEQLDTILVSKVKWVYLCDSSLLFDKVRAKKILRYCIPFKKQIRFEFGIGQLDDELIDILLDMPESEFNFGIQTINPKALSVIGRGFNQKVFEKEYSALSGHHNVTVDLIYGLPEDNFEGYKNSLDYVSSFSPKRILTNPLILLPGSRFWREKNRYGIEYDKETHLVKSTNTFSEEDMKKAREYSFKVVTGKDVEDAPDLIPTVKKGFERRNKWLKSA
jgi:radical SAM superfamily enzyme YgiQ (UPF0313 family)